MAMQQKLQYVLELVDNFSKQADIVLSRVEKFQKQTQNLSQTMKSVGTSLTLASAPLIAFGIKAVKATADLEQARIAFETMLGSAEEAESFMEKLRAFEKVTPFEIDNLIEASQKLLAFGSTADQVFIELEALGDIAAGVGIDKLPQLITAFGQVEAKGRLMGQELLQFTEAGVPLGQKLANMFGVTGEEITKMVETGQVGFDDVKQALIEMTEEGGKFDDLMEKQSNTLSGKWSTLMSSVQNLMTSIFSNDVQASMRDFLDSLAQSVGKLTEAWTQLSPETQKFILMLGTVAVIVGPLLITLGIFAGAIAALASPIGLVILTFGLLGVALVLAWKAIQSTFDLIDIAVEAFSKAFFNSWNTVVTFLTSVWESISMTVQSIWDSVESWVSTKMETIYTVTTTWMESLKNWFVEKKETLVNAISAVWDAVKDRAIAAWDGIKSAIRSSIQYVIDKINSLIQGAQNLINAVPGIDIELPTITVPALAEGGIVTRPTLAMIGEAGPEAVVPLRSAGFISRGGGSVTNNIININWTGAVDSNSAREVARTIVKELNLNVQYSLL